MAYINDNYQKLPGSYLFSEIAKRIKTYQTQNPAAKIIRLGIGDVTQPLPKVCIDAMKHAVDEMGDVKTFRGYGPEQGYEFLREKIADYNYKQRGINVEADEIFISDGSKCDCGNIQEIFGLNNKIAIADPVYPVYLDTNVMAGRTGDLQADGHFEGVVYLPCTAENNFAPAIPNEHVDMIYLCSPNNPTGTTISKSDLKRWVDYAKANDAIILYDAAYAAYITEDDVPRSIYEVEGARDCAIEFRSFSKTAGFTGTRCGYVVIPRELTGKNKNGDDVPLKNLWLRRQTTKFNGTAYIVQRGAEAIYSEDGQNQVHGLVNYYMENAKIIRDGLKDIGLTAYGGVNAPYIWLQTPKDMPSWTFFDKLLNEANVVGTPGAGFGPCGEGYFRLTAFGDRSNTIEAMERIKMQLQL
ncbi:MAG: LL-diaminopimelate aminotransferase [Selenomonadaceae bacterium]|nr:LL-diaminopimelate aminotransferase [Selenomonadaceae bacterium]MBR1859954.1 LL-diaminopimelate aminotransferase [Selenomonadaceae bacterium]